MRVIDEDVVVERLQREPEPRPCVGPDQDAPRRFDRLRARPRAADGQARVLQPHIGRQSSDQDAQRCGTAHSSHGL